MITLNITDPEEHAVELIRIERLPVLGWLLHPVTNETLLTAPVTVLCVLGVCRIQYRAELATQEDGVLDVDDFTYSAADAGNHSVTVATVWITVSTELLPLSGVSTVSEDVRTWIALSGLNLAQPNAFRVALVSLPELGTLFLNSRAVTPANLLVPLLNHTGLVQFQSELNFVGNVSLQFILTNSIGRRSAAVTQRIEVQAVNDAPVLSCPPGPASGPSAELFTISPFLISDPDPDTDVYHARVEIISISFFKKASLLRGRYESELTFTEGDFEDAFINVFHGSRRAVIEAIRTIGVATSVRPGVVRVTILDGAHEVSCETNFTVVSDTSSLLGPASNAGTALIIALTMVICVPVALCKLAGLTHEAFNKEDYSMQKLREFMVLSKSKS
jgi:hypothetical protein